MIDPNLTVQLSVCTDCLHLHANGELPADADPTEPEPLSLIARDMLAGDSLAMGVDEHADTCTDEDRQAGCNCADFGKRTSSCDGCGS